MRIVVLDGQTLNPGDNPWTSIAALGELAVYDRTPPGLIAERAASAEIVLTNKTPLRAEALAALPAVRFIAVLATGHDIVDVAAARARDIPVANVPEYGTASVAQHVFALLLELTNGVGEHDAAVKAGAWSAAADFCFWKAPPIELTGQTMGIVGLGRIGRRVAALAEGFGMEILAAHSHAGERPHQSVDEPRPVLRQAQHGRTPSSIQRTPLPLTLSPSKGHPELVEGFPGAPSVGDYPEADIETLFARADVVSLHCPLTAANARFVNRDLLQRMKPTAVLINTARGGLIDEPALAAALAAGTLAGAAVDVVSAEPMRPDNPLLHAPRCLLTPHIAWASLAARRRLMQTTADNIAAFLAGRALNVVN